MLRTSHLALAANLALGVGACVLALPHAGAQPHTGALPQAQARPDAAASAVIRDVNGKVLGTLRIERYSSAASRVTVFVRGLTPGFHGFHIHSAGVCDPASVDPDTGSPFASAGGHMDQGQDGDAGGNLPSLLATADGVASTSFLTDRFTPARLRDADGSAIIIHAKPDNFANIPSRYTHPKDATGTTGPDAATLKTGDAGRRIACGVVHVAS
ncbi:superoxide dismutase family protein [Microbispora sp. ATCC PTA-5024]|uniref:superoxide dismutase family protein n=1 Tax=Microbispora sp. ATCC PTA-5024 TaxID=316330 RepID=UPI0003DC9D46|nr:superoxide dismutase family protein [Microbispora sp. ATCC PTA-5024]ETK31794.1 hypothetical protein MPTA5024_33230 [Microbispora sp. ATCC PTA-5024]